MKFARRLTQKRWVQKTIDVTTLHRVGYMSDGNVIDMSLFN